MASETPGKLCCAFVLLPGGHGVVLSSAWLGPSGLLSFWKKWGEKIPFFVPLCSNKHSLRHPHPISTCVVKLGGVVLDPRQVQVVISALHVLVLTVESPGWPPVDTLLRLC